MDQEQGERLRVALSRLPSNEREAWIAEVTRLVRLIEQYDEIHPKRKCDPFTGEYVFTFPVQALCQEAACQDPVILKREPHRGRPPSAYTLDDWLRDYRRHGVLTFLRCLSPVPTGKTDRRRAKVSPAAVKWLNTHWRNFQSVRALYRDWQQRAKIHGWTIPSQQWLYRRWHEMPSIVQAQHRSGRQAYESRYAPYVPRDLSDLAAFQVLCGDHSERDVTVRLKDGSLARPWLTMWQDLRTGLIWGWHLDLVPSSLAAGLAYADGVQHFGAQPLSRPEDGFFSFIYTDQGKDYRSHHWDGHVLAVHKEAMRIDGGLELLLVQRRVGILDELSIKHILARGYNAKEKPIERVHRDISDWEQNTFTQYCGRDRKTRPDCWQKLYAQHQQWLRGKREASPFISFEAYREALAGYITWYNASEHERLGLAGARLVPLDEYRRLYTTRYEIAPESLALLLMKAEKRVIRKNGVQCFQKQWFY